VSIDGHSRWRLGANFRDSVPVAPIRVRGLGCSEVGGGGWIGSTAEAEHFKRAHHDIPAHCETLQSAAMAIRLMLIALLLWYSPLADARTVYRCVRDGTVSLATAPEPGSQCEAKQVQDNVAKVPNLWGDLGVFHGTLYEWKQADGSLIYTTRQLPGAKAYLKFTARTPEGSPAHTGLGQVGEPRLNMYAWQFQAAASANRIDEAWLRAIAHAESGFNASAVSAKGAQGVMQLMPGVASEYGVSNPFASDQSIKAGARYLGDLLRRYRGDLTLAAAAYNAGIGAVAQYRGVPPYPETQEYVEKVRALHARYRAAMKLPPLDPPLPAAQ